MKGSDDLPALCAEPLPLAWMKTKTLRSIVCALGLLVAFGAVAWGQIGPAPITIGFGFGFPYEHPVDWTSSFSYLTTEALLTPNLTIAVDLGTYPASFPDRFEATGSLLLKAWVGPVNAFAGGGLTLQTTRVGSAWAISPHLTLKGGFQIWPIDALAIIIQFRTHESIPVDWVFSPEISFGFSMALGSGRPDPLIFDPMSLWLVIGLGVAALIAFLPRQ